MKNATAVITNLELSLLLKILATSEIFRLPVSAKRKPIPIRISVAPIVPIGIEYRLDHLNQPVIIFINAVLLFFLIFGKELWNTPRPIIFLT